MDPFGVLRATVPVALVVQYSVAIGIAVNVFGFVIASVHYSRAGVHPARIPLRVIVGAGASFTAFTWFFAHIGHASCTLAKSGEYGEATMYFGLAFMATRLISAYFIRYYGPLIYRLVCILAGATWALVGPPRPFPLITAEAVTFPVPAFAMIVALGLLWLYANIFYGDLARALGGAAPSPVRIALIDAYDGSLPDNARIYEVISDTGTVVLELEFDEASGVKRRDDMTGALVPFRNKYPPVRYLRLPLTAVREIEYTDTFHKAPTYGARIATVPGQGEGQLSSPGDGI